MNDWIEAEGRAERAHNLYEKGRWAEAAAELRAAIEVNPYVASWHFNLALTLEAMEEYARAREAYLASLNLNADDVETLNGLGCNATDLGRYDEALSFFQKIERRQPPTRV